MSTIYIPSGAQGATAGPYISTSVATGANGAATWTTNATGTGGTISNTMTVDGDASFSGNVIVKGRNLVEMLEKIEDRLAILTPDPVKLAKFEALKKAYDNYKMLEALCQVDEDDSNN